MLCNRKKDLSPYSSCVLSVSFHRKGGTFSSFFPLFFEFCSQASVSLKDTRTREGERERVGSRGGKRGREIGYITGFPSFPEPRYCFGSSFGEYTACIPLPSCDRICLNQRVSSRSPATAVDADALVQGTCTESMQNEEQ